MIPNLKWKKSSRSAGNNGDCVELALDVGVRDTKNQDVVLKADVYRLLDAVKAGAFDR